MLLEPNYITEDGAWHGTHFSTGVIDNITEYVGPSVGSSKEKGDTYTTIVALQPVRLRMA